MTFFPLKLRIFSFLLEESTLQLLYGISELLVSLLLGFGPLTKRRIKHKHCDTKTVELITDTKWLRAGQAGQSVIHILDWIEQGRAIFHYTTQHGV